MYDSTERIRLVKIRAIELDHKRENRLLSVFSGLSLILAFSLVITIHFMMGFVEGNVKGAYGAMLLYEDAGGYVLVAVIAFVLATLITFLCIKNRDKSKKIKEDVAKLKN